MAEDGSTTRQASADGESGVHRLRDIVVEEVSLVDRAANKRRFLVVKRSSQMSDDKGKDRGTSQEGRVAAVTAGGGKKLKPKPGESVDKARPRVMRAGSEDDEDDEETEKARRSSEDDEDEETEKARRSAKDEEEEDTEKADDEEDEEDDEEDEEDESRAGKARTRAKRGTRAGDGETANQSRGRAGKPTDKADDDELVLPAAAKNAILRVLAQALERLMAVANQVKEADAPDDDTDPNVPDDLAAELEEIGELLEDVGEQLADPAAKAEGKKPRAAKGRAAKGDVAKAGRRMAKDRLDRFQKALEQLSAILKELTEAKALPEPSAGSAANPLAKRNVPAGVDGLLAELRKLTGVVKQQEARIVQLQKTGVTSNAIPVEGGSRGRAVQDVSWPLDMNRPITRDRVDKAISFYDEE
jgi:hypothetical protein